MKISAIILTKNEEKNIERCIESVKWCDEIIILDDNSEDTTIKRLKGDTIRVVKRNLQGDFASQRNFGLSQAKGEWVLFIDADEVISPELFHEIQFAITDSLSGAKGYYLKRIDYLWGKKLTKGENLTIKLLRLGKKDAGVWEGKVHEVWKIQGKTGILRNPLIHYPHQSLSEFLKEINIYTTIRASELYSKKTTVHWWSIILYPFSKFFVNYFVKQGFTDGSTGMVFALLMSFHSYLVRGKLWLLWHKNGKV